ncbi:hypothetical protein RAS1_11970 [Phycisphaerae bacterium RAS1]|nr:hypothetical protein RAS1_11970 [Phycisphaerae bacterium RAS1]
MRAAVIGLLVAATAVAGLAFAWPLVVAASELWACDDWSIAVPGLRGWGLLARGVVVSIAACGVALFLGTMLAAGLVWGVEGRVARLVGLVSLLVLLTPPYLYAYAWSLPLLPEGIAVAPVNMRFPRWLTCELRAVWCLGTWCAPIAAGLMASGWRRAGFPAYRMALLDGSVWRAALAGLKPTRPWVVLAALVILLVSLVEFSVCHLCQVLTWNTEVLVQTQALERAGRSLLLAWPLVAISLGLLVALVARRAMIAEWLADIAAAPAIEGLGDKRVARCAADGVALCAGVVLLLPIVIFVASMRDWTAMGRLWRVYPTEWPGSLLSAGGATLASGVLGLATAWLASISRGGRTAANAAVTAAIAIALVGAALPPAVTGDLFAAAYARLPLIRDQFWIICLVETARFAFIPMIAGALTARVSAAALREAAAVDGAGPPAAFARVVLPEVWPTLAAALAVVGALSLTEVAASQLVAPPGCGNLARTLLNAIHFGRNDDVIALALTVVLFLIPLAWVAGRTWRQGDKATR